jgi:CheY-like chemotaxis protein
MKVLVVDDENLIRKSLCRAFLSRGHEVREACDGVEGLGVWREWPPDLAIVDVLMPGLTGPQLLEQADIGAAKVILISAYTGDFDVKKAQNLGAHLFLAKPFQNIFEIVECAEDLVKNKPNEHAK